MAKRRGKKRSRRRAKKAISLAVVGGLVSGLINPLKLAKDGRWEEALAELVNNYTGYRPLAGKWDFSAMKDGLIPLLIGAGISKLATKLGLNREIKKATMGIIKI